MISDIKKLNVQNKTLTNKKSQQMSKVLKTESKNGTRQRMMNSASDDLHRDDA